MCGSLVVRHEILGVGPKHRFILENPSGKQTQNEEMGRKQTKEKVIRLTQLSTDRLFTVIPKRATDQAQPTRGPLPEVPHPGILP